MAFVANDRLRDVGRLIVVGGFDIVGLIARFVVFDFVAHDDLLVIEARRDLRGALLGVDRESACRRRTRCSVVSLMVHDVVGILGCAIERFILKRFDAIQIVNRSAAHRGVKMVDLVAKFVRDVGVARQLPGRIISGCRCGSW